MHAESVTIAGVVKNGVVVPEGSVHLPEGAHVSILIAMTQIPPDLLDEFQAWERVSDEAWGMIDEWEKEERPLQRRR